MKPKKVSAALASIVNLTAKLDNTDRALLIQILHSQGTQPEGYALLQRGFQAISINLRAYTVMSKEWQPKLIAICAQVTGLGVSLSPDDGGLRAHYALTCAWVKAAAQHLIDKHEPVSEFRVFDTLYKNDMLSLLQRGFPGYTITMLGRVLCQQPLSGSGSSAATILNAEPEAPTSEVGTSTSSVPGVRTKIRPTTSE